MKKYIVGSVETLPKKIQNKIMQFKKLDGSIGYELHGYLKNTVLRKGDIIMIDGKDRITVKHGKKEMDAGRNSQD